MLALDGTVLTWNLGAQRMNGYAPAEIIGQHFSIFYRAEERAAGRPDEELRVALAEGRYEEEGWRVRKDGTPFWANVVISALYDSDGHARGFGNVTRDLSERRDAEDRYRLLVEGVRDYAIITLDTDGVVQSWNTGAERIKATRPTRSSVGTSVSSTPSPTSTATTRPPSSGARRRSAATRTKAGVSATTAPASGRT